MQTQDPYNYPFIQRDNTMYLSTISNKGLIQLKMILEFDLNTKDSQHFRGKTLKAHFQKL